jgi:hypothetical protein
LKLYNGTSSRITKLPNGGHIEQNNLSLTVMSIDDLKPALDSIIYNQIQKCNLSIKDNRKVELNLLERSLILYGDWPIETLVSIVQFCKTNEVENFTIRF